MILPRNPLQTRAVSSGNYVWIVCLFPFFWLCNGSQRQILAAVAAAFLVLIVVISVIRRRRIRSATPPRYLPSNYLRQRWQEWRPQNTYAGIVTGRGTRAPAPSTNRTSSEIPTSSVHESRTEADFANNRLSVRSIVTLPPYNAAPLPSERLIAREGERAGVDTVLEYPESETEVETRREEEMDQLYTIREARRREQREREERRAARREARERGDWLRLEALEAESRARARARTDSNTNAEASADHSRRPSDTSSLAPAVTARSQQDSSLLIAELNSLREHNARARRVSSVSYADLGVARHDGSRIRADSIDSDHRPLLDSAASIGRSRATSRASSTGGDDGRRSHSRSRSRAAPFRDESHDRRPSTGGSNWTTTTSRPDEDQAEAERGSADFLTPQSSAGSGDAGSELANLPPDPPSYEDDVSVHGGELGDAPPYSSPVLERNPAQFPAAPAPAHIASNTGSVERAISPRASAEVLRADTSEAESGRQGRQSAQEQVRPSAQSEAEGFELQPTESGGAAELPPLRLLVTNESSPPSIEVSSATPVSSVPPTPRRGGF